MRLHPQEVEAIKAAAVETFGASVVVRLFGSRVRDDLKGGDIDLHCEIDTLNDQWQAKDDFLDALFQQLEPQKVDLLLSVRGRTPQGFERIAYRDGVVL